MVSKILDLIARILTEHLNDIQRNNRYMKTLNRRVEVECYLLACAAGKYPLPDKDKCRSLALKLGNYDG